MHGNTKCTPENAVAELFKEELRRAIGGVRELYVFM